MSGMKAQTKARSPGFALPGKRRRSVLSMAPLIDFTFILLIFFMVVTQFDRFTAVDVSVSKAPVRTAQPPPPQPRKTKKLRLTIRADGVFLLDGEEIGDIDSFTGVLAHHQPPQKAAATEKPLLMVDPEPEVSVQLLIDAMNALKTLPGFNVRIVMKGDVIRRPAREPAAGQTAGAPPLSVPPPPFAAMPGRNFKTRGTGQ
jgi:biopolymer transport protein ExbD